MAGWGCGGAHAGWNLRFSHDLLSRDASTRIVTHLEFLSFKLKLLNILAYFGQPGVHAGGVAHLRILYVYIFHLGESVPAKKQRLNQDEPPTLRSDCV